VSQEGGHIEGSCADRFSGVREAFAENFARRDEVGASVAVTLDGELVVDLWGGHTDEARTTLWTRDTIAGVASTSKTVTALCALVLADRGELDLDAPVARYWPQFAQGGKADVLVRQVLGHTAALPGWTEPIAFEDLYDWDKVTGLLARQAPWWPPGGASAYHAITHGYLIGEVVRRITGRTLGRFLADEVAGPLGADFHIGLDPAHHHRVAHSIAAPPAAAAQMDPTSVFARIADNPRIPEFSQIDPQRWLSAEIPASNGVGNARSVARLQSVLACGGEANGRRLLSREGCEAVLRQQSDGVDRAFLTPVRWAMGFARELAGLNFGPRTCFWGGSGGSLVVVDLERRMSFAYVMNRMVGAPFGDPRNVPLIAATYAALRDCPAATAFSQVME
jgi:CubicO group peptidase (beta-lactamase class C family)